MTTVRTPETESFLASLDLCREKKVTRPELTHTCILPSEHDDEHECACGHHWREVNDGNTKAKSL